MRKSAELAAFIAIVSASAAFSAEVTAGNNLVRKGALGIAEGKGSSESLVVDGGDVLLGYVDGVPRDGGYFLVAVGEGSSASVTLRDGCIRASGSPSAQCMRIAEGKDSRAQVLVEGGRIEAQNNWGRVRIAAGQNSTASVLMTGGSWVSGEEFRIGDNSGANGVFTNRAGSVWCGYNFAIGATSGGYGEYVSEGGSFTQSLIIYDNNFNHPGGTIWVGGSSGTGRLVMKGGSVSTPGDAYVGTSNGTGELEMSGGTVDLGGTLNVGATGGRGSCRLTGGVLRARRIAAGDGTGSVLFDGGTFEAASGGNDLMPQSGNLTFSVGEGGATVDSASYENTISAAIGDGAPSGRKPGALVFRGGGTVNLNGPVASSIGIVVEGGMLAVTNGYAFAGPVVVRGGGRIKLKTGGTGAVRFEGQVEVCEGGVLDLGASQVECGANGRLVVNGGTVYAIPSVDGQDFSISGVDAAQGVDVAAAFRTKGCTYSYVPSLRDGALTFTAAGLAASNGAKTLWIGGSEGNWWDSANWTLGVPSAVMTAEVANDAVVWCNGDKSVSNLIVSADVTFRSTDIGRVHPKIKFREIGGGGTVGIYHVGLYASGLPGTVAEDTSIDVKDVSQTSDSWLESAGAGTPFVMRGKIKGSGYLRLYNTIRFCGDNTAFTGKVYAGDADKDRYFCSGKSGFPNAYSCEIVGKINVALMDGCVTFGAFALTGSGSHHGINFPAGSKAKVVVGNGGRDASIGSGVKFYTNSKSDFSGSWSDGAPGASLVKVGSGTLASALGGAGTLEVAQGVARVSSGDSALALVVRSGAVLTPSAQGMRFASVNMERGAALTVDSVSSPKTIYAGRAAVGGAKLEAAGDAIAEISASTGPAEATLLSCDAELAGRPAAFWRKSADGGWWHACAGNRELSLCRDGSQMGFSVSITSGAERALSALASRPRLVVLTDIANEPDDQGSVTRLLSYANEFNFEGIVATTSIHMKDNPREDLLLAAIDRYEQVYPNLCVHAPGYPTPDFLRSVTAKGQTGYGTGSVGYSTRGSQMLARAILRDDPRTLWVSVWGGANTLLRALREAKASASSDEAFAKAAGRVKVYSISDQDNAGFVVRTEFPEVCYIVDPCPPDKPGDGGNYNNTVWRGISGDMHGSVRFPYRNMLENIWIEENVKSKSPLGAFYPSYYYYMEGDTPAFLGLVENGLGWKESPAYGGWGGRYEWRMPDSDKETHEVWRSPSEWEEFDGKKLNFCSIARWRREFQSDFAARILWGATSRYEDANHNPVAVLNGDTTKGVVRIKAARGETIALSADGTCDPDGDQVEFEWFIYRAAGTLNGGSLASDGASATVSLADVSPGDSGELHVILRVKDGGKPALFAYRRAVIAVGE